MKSGEGASFPLEKDYIFLRPHPNFKQDILVEEIKGRQSSSLSRTLQFLDLTFYRFVFKIQVGNEGLEADSCMLVVNNYT